jgi:flagellar basal-body rod protein FlgF
LSSGFYAACAGLRAQTQALELIAGDVANISTTGYRGQQPLFGSLLASAHGESSNPLNRAINDFGVLEGSRTDLSSGNLEKTGNPLDLAIEGKGFFAIQTRAGILYTRNGNFQISPHGQLTTNAGDLVLGEQGRAVGNSYYSATAKGLRPAADSSIRQNMLEGSNVNSVQAVVALIAVQRHAEMLERAMSMFATNLDHIAANDLPKI